MQPPWDGALRARKNPLFSEGGKAVFCGLEENADETRYKKEDMGEYGQKSIDCRR